MARTAKTTRSTEVAVPARRGRPPGPAKTATAGKAAPARKAAARRPTADRVAAARPAPKVSKDELRAQVEKLERSNAALRTKSRELGRAAKAAAARIEELEAQVVRLEKKAAAAKPAPAAAEPKRARAARGGGHRREQDPGDVVPPGVAVQDPEPLEAEADAARQKLEELGED